MGIIVILFILPINLLLLVGTLKKTILYVKKTKDYRLFWVGVILGIIEMVIIVSVWAIKGKIYAFTPISTPFVWIILISILTFILSRIPSNISKKASEVFSANAVSLIVLAFALFFIIKPLLELLNIKVYY